EALQITLARRVADLTQEEQRRRPALARLQAALPADAALIDLVEIHPLLMGINIRSYIDTRTGKMGVGGYRPPESEAHLLAFVVRRAGRGARVDRGEGRALGAGGGRGRRAGGPFLPQEFRDRLWKPLEPHLAGVRALWVSPDDPLCEFPWAALP